MYPEQVVVTGTVEIVGAGRGTGPGATVITIPPSPSEYVPFGAPGCTAPTTSPACLNAIFVVNGGNATVSDLTVSGPEAVGANFLNNGVLVVGGGHLDLRDSQVTTIRDSPNGSRQAVNAVMVGTSAAGRRLPTGSAHIEGVLVDDFQKTGIIVRAGSSGELVDNVIQGRGPQGTNASNGIQIQGAASVVGNTVTGNVFTGGTSAFGIGVFSPTGVVEIRDNTVTGTQLGVYAAGAGATLTIADNALTGIDATDPLTLGLVSQWTGLTPTISGNVITAFNVGLELDGGTERAVSNSLSGNATGVALTATPTLFAANRIVGNTTGVTAPPASGITGGPNWWGCNGGPNASGCDSASEYAEADWLVLSVDLTTCSVTAGQRLPLTVARTHTASGRRSGPHSFRPHRSRR